MRREHVVWVLLALFAYALYLVLEPFWTAVAWAAILGTLLAPLYEKLERWIPSRRWRAFSVSAVAALVILGPFLVLVVLATLRAIDNIQDLQQRLQDAATLADVLPAGLVQGVDSWIRRLGEIEGIRGLVGADSLQGLLRAGINQALQSALDLGSVIVTDLLSLSLVVAMTWIALFYLLEDGRRLLELIYDLLPFPEGAERKFMGRLAEMVFSVLYCSLAVAAVQGALGGIGFAIVGIPNAFLWGLVMVPLALVPIFGTGLVWVPAAVILGVQGHWWAAIFLVAWGSGVIAISDNFIRPILLSGRTSMHPLLIFLGVLGGIQAFGVLGLFLGPVLIAVLVTIIDFYREGEAAGVERAGEPA